MKNIAVLLNTVALTSILSLTYTSAYSMPLQVENELKQLMAKGTFRQGLQMGMMGGFISTYCMLTKEGIVVPNEGPMTEEDINEVSRMLLQKARAEFEGYLFPYQKAGVNLGINECNKNFGMQLDYR